jgi:hypothetical protein
MKKLIKFLFFLVFGTFSCYYSFAIIGGLFLSLVFWSFNPLTKLCTFWVPLGSENIMLSVPRFFFWFVSIVGSWVGAYQTTYANWENEYK